MVFPTFITGVGIPLFLCEKSVRTNMSATDGHREKRSTHVVVCEQCFIKFYVFLYRHTAYDGSVVGGSFILCAPLLVQVTVLGTASKGRGF